MQLKEEAIFTLKFDGKPVVNELGILESKLQEVKTAQKDVEKGTQEWANNKENIKQLEAAIKNVRDELGVSGMTVNQLQGYYRQLNTEIRALTPGTEAYQKKAADLQEVNTALANHRQSIRGVADEVDKQPSLWDKAKVAMAAYFTVTGLIEAGRMILNYFVDSVKQFREFQSAAQELSAVTGATGKDLDYLKEQAKEVGPAVGKTAAEMLEAYKLMASAKPELLAQTELLAETTKAAITLSQAGQIPLAEATKVTAESLNQFGEAADQANRFINVIAAGAKEGSAEINEMGGALKASGTVAKAAGLSFEQTNAILQSMSTIALKGEQAGTNLRNVLLKLQSGAKETNPELVGMDVALENLAKKQYTAADMAKLFGTENVVAAQHIVTHRKEIGELTTKLTGTQEAFMQASKNNATYDHEVEKMKATLNAFSVDMVQSFMPALTKGVQGVVAFVNVIRAVPEFLSENRTSLIALGVAILAFNGNLIVATASSIAHAAAEKARIIWTNSGTAAQLLLNAAMSANPIGLIIAGVALLVAGFSALYNNSITVRSGINGLWQAMQTAAGVAVQFVKAFISLDFKGMADAMMNGGGKVADAYNKGYADTLAAARPKIIADHAKHVDDKVKLEGAAAAKINTNSVLEHEKELAKKEKAAEKLRISEAKKAAEAAKKEADESVKANNEGLKQIETLRIASIQDDLTRSIATIRAKRDAEVEAMTASKASAQTKAVWEKALNEQMIRDIAKATTDAATKKATEEAKARADREKLERDTSNAVAEANYDAAHQALEKQLADERIKISTRKSINMELINMERTETLRKINDQYTAEVNKLNKEKADAIRTAQERGQSIDGIENQFRQQYSAAELARRNRETAAETAFQNDKKEIEKASLEARKANQQAWFDAIKGLMSGDFSTFTNFLAQKLAGEKKELSDSQKANVAKIDAVGQYTALATQALTALSQAKLNKELANINTEKTTQLAAWKEKYDRGLINKDQYEKGIDSINKEADQKTKQAQLEAFKRQQKIDIALAIINGIQAALKSLAMFGWPLGLIGAAGAAVAAGVQIALIKKQQPPSLASGGKIRNAGVPEGPRHGSSYGDSGLSIMRRDTGEEVAEMEGGEPVMVLSRNTYKNNRPVIDSLMHSSLHRNGAPVLAKGGIMFEDGGYTQADQSSSVYSGSSGGSTSQEQGSTYAPESDPAPSDSGSSWMTDAGTTSDSINTGDYQAAVEKSTAQMDAIMKNTADTVDGIKAVVENVITMQQQLQTGFGTMHTDLITLHGTMKMEFPSLGTDLMTELSLLRSAVGQGLVTLGTGINQDVTKLAIVTKDGLDSMTKIVHTDLDGMTKVVHEDIETLNKDVNYNLIMVGSAAHTDSLDMQRAQALQQTTLLNETKLAFTTLQTILKTELETLQLNTKADLADLQNSNKAELQIIQEILNRTQNEQGYQSTLLRIISEKNLSVSVQSIVSVWNQIDVVIDKSNFK